MIGSGVFLLAGYAASPVSGGVSFMLAWVFGGLMALWGTATTAELATKFPHTGGDFLYLRRVYGRYPAFLYGWMSLAIFQSGSIGILAVFSARYALEIIPFLKSADTSAESLASFIIVFYTLLHSLRVTVGARFQSVLTLLKAVGILLLGYVLFTATGEVKPGAGSPFEPASPMGGFARALVPIFFAYSGWNAVGYVAGEVKNPGRALPIAFIAGTVTTLVLYLFVNGAFLSAMGIDAMRGDPMVPLSALRSVSTRGWELFLTALIFVSVFSSLSVAVQVGARVVQSMGEHGVFFKKVAHVQPTLGTPVVALVLQGVWSIVLIHLLDLEKLVDSTTVVMVLFSALTISTVFRARKMEEIDTKHKRDRFQTPAYPWIPIAYIISCLFISVGVIQFYLSQRSFLPFLGFLFVASGTVVFLIWRKVVGE